ncbi:hypothetical protein ACP70R_036043 [Stipagrostis hirtigluma subsp. patula]
MADVEDPNPDGGGGVIAATPEPDDLSSCAFVCVGALCTCSLVAISVLPVLFYRAHRTASLGVRVAATILLVVGIIGFVLATCCCAVFVQEFLCGNTAGKRQDAAAAAAAAAA